MSVHKTDRGWLVRWRDGQRNRQRSFDRKGDADRWETELRRRQQLGTLNEIDAGRETMDEYVTGTWAKAHAGRWHRRRAPSTRGRTTRTSPHASAGSRSKTSRPT